MTVGLQAPRGVVRGGRWAARGVGGMSTAHSPFSSCPMRWFLLATSCFVKKKKRQPIKQIIWILTSHFLLIVVAQSFPEKKRNYNFSHSFLPLLPLCPLPSPPGVKPDLGSVKRLSPWPRPGVACHIQLWASGQATDTWSALCVRACVCVCLIVSECENNSPSLTFGHLLWGWKRKRKKRQSRCRCWNFLFLFCFLSLSAQCFFLHVFFC